MTEDSPVGNKLFGVYRGQVIQHLTHGYCKIYIPSVYPEEWKDKPQFLPPAEQAASLFGGTNNGSGVFTYPNIGSIVWCLFANNDQNYPIYFAACLGGENAFGQHEIIKRPDEEVSERHLITSGKTHIEWYENGKLSVQVEDPDRRDAIVSYNNNYISQISDDAVSAWPICDKVANNEISNIHCKLVMDNDGSSFGVISAQTHHYDLLSNDAQNMMLSNDIDMSFENSGNAKLNMLSTYSYADQNNTCRTQSQNVMHLAFPGKFESKISRKEDITKDAGEHQIALNSSLLQTKNTDGHVKNFLSYDNMQKYSDNEDKTKTILAIEHSIDSGYAYSMQHDNTSKGQSQKTVSNSAKLEMFANINDNVKKTVALASDIVNNGTVAVSAKALDEIDLAAATIETQIQNNLPEKLIVALDKTDATESSREIRLTDLKSSKEALLRIDTKNGFLKISVKSLSNPDSNFSTIHIDTNGNVFVESSASAVLKTKTASIEVENQLDIKATTVKIESKVDTTIVSPSISLDSSAGHTKITSARGEKSF